MSKYLMNASGGESVTCGPPLTDMPSECLTRALDR
jgi:hypothetical protein